MPSHAQKKNKKSRWNDLLLIIIMIGALLIVLHLIPKNGLTVFNLAIFLLLLIPTLMALINGAPFVPTPMEAVKKMLQAANIKQDEKVYDIGCGDGRMVHLAAKDYGADAIGFELSPIVYALARIRHLLWQSKAKIFFRNFKHVKFDNANVILCYLMPETLAKLQPKLDRELKKGTRIISYAFPIGTWEERQHIARDTAKNLAPIWVYEKD